MTGRDLRFLAFFACFRVSMFVRYMNWQRIRLGFCLICLSLKMVRKEILFFQRDILILFLFNHEKKTDEKKTGEEDCG